jgi:hypothetical protein
MVMVLMCQDNLVKGAYGNKGRENPMTIIQGGLNPVVAAVNNAVPRNEPNKPDPVVKQVKAPARGEQSQRYTENQARDNERRGRKVDVDV